MLIPTAPPRLMPAERYVDVLAETARYGWWGTHASAPAGLGNMTNERAAMPSLHVGWTVWVAWALWPHTRLVGRVLGCLYVLGTAFVVVATGNHWILDAVMGAAVVALGIALSARIETRASGRSALAMTVVRPTIARDVADCGSSATGPTASAGTSAGVLCHPAGGLQPDRLVLHDRGQLLLQHRQLLPAELTRQLAVEPLEDQLAVME